jgi:hypothetical protein
MDPVVALGRAIDELGEFRLAEVGEGSGGAALHRVEGEVAPADTAELHLPGSEVVDWVGQQPIGHMHQEIPKGSPISQRRLRRRFAPPEKYYYMTLEVIICLIIRIHLQGKLFLSSKSAHCFSGEAAWHYHLSLTASCTTTASA